MARRPADLGSKSHGMSHGLYSPVQAANESSACATLGPQRCLGHQGYHPGPFTHRRVAPPCLPLRTSSQVSPCARSPGSTKLRRWIRFSSPLLPSRGRYGVEADDPLRAWSKLPRLGFRRWSSRRSRSRTTGLSLSLSLSLGRSRSPMPESRGLASRTGLPRLPGRAMLAREEAGDKLGSA